MRKKMKIVVTVPKEMEGLSVEMVIDENIKELMVQIVENNKVESTLHEEKQCVCLSRTVNVSISFRLILSNGLKGIINIVLFI